MRSSMNCARSVPFSFDLTRGRELSSVNDMLQAAVMEESIPGRGHTAYLPSFVILSYW
jgi:hypothetical protein